MANTSFVEKAAQIVSELKWEDIFSDYRKPHSKRDLDYLLMAGSDYTKHSEADMFHYWQKPWLFWRFLIIGLCAIGALYAVELCIIGMSGACTYAAINLPLIVIPPMIPPIALMIFFWELNIPRNISIYNLAGYFIAGGILSIFFTAILNDFLQPMHAYAAPLTEEPAKLLASILFIQIAAKRSNIRIYGVTGLCIGAAVGAGFGAFESAQYAYNLWLEDGGGIVMNEAMLADIFWNSHFLRGILAVGGHTLFCAPYSAAVALHCNQKEFTSTSLTSSDFLGAFLISVVVHFLWNDGLGIISSLGAIGGLIGLFLGLGILSFVLWCSTLSVTQKCMHQLSKVAVGMGYQRNARHPNQLILQIFTENGSEKEYRISENKKMVQVGKTSSCEICLPNIPGLSRKHCLFQYDAQQGKWFFTDTNSSCGSFTKDGKHLTANKPYPVYDGMCIYLGSKKVLIAITCT